MDVDKTIKKFTQKSNDIFEPADPKRSLEGLQKY